MKNHVHGSLTYQSITLVARVTLKRLVTLTSRMLLWLVFMGKDISAVNDKFLSSVFSTLVRLRQIGPYRKDTTDNPFKGIQRKEGDALWNMQRTEIVLST